MAKDNIGLLFRSYAKKPEGVTEVVARAVESARKAAEEEIKRVIFIVPTDADCGSTARMLRFALADEPVGEVFEATGNQNSDVLNKGMKMLQDDGIKYAGIVSNKAAGLLNATFLQAVQVFLTNGEFCVGIQIQELDDVQEVPITNTCAFWDINKLLHVGGFDSQIGVEEITALVRLMREYGDGATIITATAGGELNVRKSADGQAHHASVKETKRARQESEAARMGVDLKWLWHGIKTV